MTKDDLPTVGECTRRFRCAQGDAPHNVTNEDWKAIADVLRCASSEGAASVDICPPHRVWQDREGKRTPKDDNDVAAAWYEDRNPARAWCDTVSAALEAQGFTVGRARKFGPRLYVSGWKRGECGCTGGGE